MRQHRLTVALLLGAGALLLAPATGSAQISIGAPYYAGQPSPAGYSYYPYGAGALAWPGAYSYTQRYYWYGDNWPYRGYFVGKYHTEPYFPPGGPPTPQDSTRSAFPERTSSYPYGDLPDAEQKTARVEVRLPNAEAQVWFEGQLTRKQGTQRGFVSPPLEADKKYVYEVKARWTENGKVVERTQSVTVRPDGVSTVDFTAAAQ